MLAKNKSYIIISALIISIGLIFFGISNRYYIDSSTKLKVDKLTGKTYELSNGQWKNIESSQADSSTVQVQNTKLINADFVKNLELLKTTVPLYNNFKEYYKTVITEYEKNPLFYKNSFSEIMYPLYQKYGIIFEEYSPLLMPENICEAISQHNIKNADNFIDFTINYYKNN